MKNISLDHDWERSLIPGVLLGPCHGDAKLRIVFLDFFLWFLFFLLVFCFLLLYFLLDFSCNAHTLVS